MLNNKPKKLIEGGPMETFPRTQFSSCKCGASIDNRYSECWNCAKKRGKDETQERINWNGSWDRAATLVAGIIFGSLRDEKIPDSEIEKELEKWQAYFWKKLQNGVPRVSHQKAKEQSEGSFVEDLSNEE